MFHKLLFIIAVSAAAPAIAQDGGAVMLQAMAAGCLNKLETGSFNTELYERANPQMEIQLLNNRSGRVWRTNDSRVVVVDFESETLCDVMGLQVPVNEFVNALTGWLGFEGRAYTIDTDANLTPDSADGAYFVRKTDDDHYIQVTVTSNPEYNFIGLNAQRVADSPAAREVLGED